uniref:Cytoplasmic dynein 1 intermediate chain 1 n=2 Tax=Schistocephalus solidus TaxID=70667 RepID=A0A0X3PSC6_SCHSO
MSAGADRKAEIELKKAKLRALREDKLRKEENRRQALSGNNSGASSTVDVRVDADAILKNLGIEPLQEPVVLPPNAQMGDGHISPNRLNVRTASGRRKKLQVCQVSEFDVKPHASETYEKEIQTTEAEPEEKAAGMDYYVLTYDDTPTENDRIQIGSYEEPVERMDTKMLKSVHGEVPRHTTVSTKAELEEPALVALTEEQKQQMLLSEGFKCFFDRSARIIERALCESEDLFLDYSGEEVKAQTSDDLLPFCLHFFDDHWSRNRMVIGLDWSTTYPELVLAAYSPNEEVVHEPAGCCMIWNLKFPRKTSPEYIFTCSEPITAATMAKFHPNLIIGGTYSGQILLWDTRSPKRTPVQRSTLTSWAHTQPLNTVQVIGSKNAHNIITLSSDGSMCAWSVEMLGEPREKLKVCDAPSAGLLDVFPTCMAFFANDQNNYVVGSESGNIYTDQRHSSRSGSTEGNAARNHPYKGHSTFVTSVATHPSPGPVSYSNLFLSSSLDWTVRLWSVREQAPLNVFDDYSECVYDVCWSPIHPALFAAVDGTGRVDVWNLNNDMEVPTARSHLPVNPGCSEPAAINKARWDSTGLFLAVGDDEGHVRVCSVAESLATPGADDWTILAQVLANLKSTSQMI